MKSILNYLAKRLLLYCSSQELSKLNCSKFEIALWMQIAVERPKRSFIIIIAYQLQQSGNYFVNFVNMMLTMSFLSDVLIPDVSI